MKWWGGLNLRIGLLPQRGWGVLRYISDGGVQSPFLGLKFVI